MPGLNSMRETAASPAIWDEASYQRLSEASGEDDTLHVAFENGDRVNLALSALLNRPGAEGKWDTLELNPYELRLTVDGEPKIVPWMDIRALADERLASHLADRASEQARSVGHHLRLLRARRGLSARELAERAGISPQSLSRIERGRHDIVFSTLQRLLAAMNLDLSDLAALGGSEVEPRQVQAALIASGLDRDTVARVLHGARNPADLLARVRRAFGWSPTDLAGPAAPPVLAHPALAGRFKAQGRSSRAADTYVMYAHTIALLAEQAAERPGYTPPPDDPHRIAAEIRERHGRVDFAGLLDYCWEHGIVVVPLFDRGQLHGACWLIADRPVVVLKQRASYHSRWAFDLAHELAHVLRHLGARQPAVVELEPIGEASDDEESEASEFANELLLGDSESLLHEVVAEAGNQGRRLKGAVAVVARNRDVDTGALANALAWRLQLDGFEFPFWSAAANLQSGERDAPGLAARVLERHLRPERLARDEALMLEGALMSDVPEPVS
jgi:transcriptional regulator with XRE-family HTH domain